MTRPADEQPTTVLPQQTVEQPSVTTSPATRRTRTWNRRIPARIGRARTSTVVIGALFVLLGGLNTLLPVRNTGTTPVTLENGLVVDVPISAIPSGALPTTAPAEPTEPTPTAGVPAPTSAQPTGTPAPSPTTEAPATTAAPTSTPRSTPSTAPAPTSTPRSTPTATTRAPSTSAAVPSEEQTPEETADPTG